MAAPIIYRWDDANAPVARGERTSLIEILTACLVDGYGDKPGAGWMRQFVNAEGTKAVFRNNPVAGTGFVLQINGATSAAANLHIVTAAEAASDLDTLLFSFGEFTCRTSNAVGTAARPWFLIADDRAFYFFVYPQQATSATLTITAIGSSPFFFGDPVSVWPDDTYCCALGGVNQSAYSDGSLFLKGYIETTSGGPGSFWIARSLTDAKKTHVCLFALSHYTNNAPLPSLGRVAGQHEPVYLFRPALSDGIAYKQRGWMPGLYYASSKPTLSCGDVILVDGQPFVFMGGEGVSVSLYYGIYISMQDWRP